MISGGRRIGGWLQQWKQSINYLCRRSSSNNMLCCGYKNGHLHMEGVHQLLILVSHIAYMGNMAKKMINLSSFY